MSDNALAEKIGELGQSLASIKEQVGNLGSDFTEKLKATGEVSAELKGKVDKALSELGETVTRVRELEKAADRVSESGDPLARGIGDHIVENASFENGRLSLNERGRFRVSMERADITSANTTVGAGRSAGTSLVPGARVPGIITPPNRQFTIRDLIAPGRTSSSSVEYVKETGFTNSPPRLLKARPSRSRT